MSKESTKIESAKLSRLVHDVHLNGTIEDCVLICKDNIASITAIDYSNSILVHVVEEIEGLPDLDIGMNSLSKLAKFLGDSEGQVKFTLNDKWVTLSRKRGKISFLTFDSEMVPTAVEDDAGLLKKLKDNVTIKFSLEQDIRDELLYYMALIGSSTTIIHHDGKKISMMSNPNDEQQFNLIASKQKSDDEQEIRVEVYSKYLSSLLKHAPSNTEVHIGHNAPVLFFVDDDNFWSLNIIE